MYNFIEKHQKIIQKICREEGISYLALFGSHARGEDTSASDVDFIVDFSKRVSLLDLSRVALRFEDTLGVKVDLVTERSIKPFLRRSINQDKRVVFHDQNKPRLYQRYPVSYRVN